jgi:hypothetical protein
MHSLPVRGTLGLQLCGARFAFIARELETSAGRSRSQSLMRIGFWRSAFAASISATPLRVQNSIYDWNGKMAARPERRANNCKATQSGVALFTIAHS